MIERAQIFSDSLDPAPLDVLAARLPGTAYRADALDDLLRQWRSEFTARQSELEELSLVAGGAALTLFSPMGRADHKIKRGARKAPFASRRPPSCMTKSRGGH